MKTHSAHTLNTIGTQLRDPIYSGLTQRRLRVCTDVRLIKNSISTTGNLQRKAAGRSKALQQAPGSVSVWRMSELTRDGASDKILRAAGVSAILAVCGLERLHGVLPCLRGIFDERTCDIVSVHKDKEYQTRGKSAIGIHPPGHQTSICGYKPNDSSASLKNAIHTFMKHTLEGPLFLQMSYIRWHKNRALLEYCCIHTAFYTAAGLLILCTTCNI